MSAIPGDVIAAPHSVGRSVPTRWHRIDGMLERMSEWLNPILIKESRQALKSKQFLITFALVLLCGWLWSFGGALIIGQQIYYSASGPEMFMGYYFILALPLLVVVPYGAYRSLASERDDRTYELLSITTLKPRQVVSGKLATALVQMIVYLSALSPCLAFTYLLRGLDVLTILVVVALTCLASMGLSALAVLLATLTSQKHWQIFWSVASVVGLVFMLMFAVSVVGEGVTGRFIPVDDRDFWIGMIALLTFYISYFALVFLSAAANLSFASENRATSLRVVMLLQQALLAAWMGFGFFEWNATNGLRNEFLIVGMTLLGIHWYVLGAMMTSESAQLSRRVKRSLPQSQAGRAFFTWLNPGPATGYVFAITSAAAGVAMVLLALSWLPYQPLNTTLRASTSQVLQFAAFGLCYLILYLGLGFLIVRFLKRFATVPVLAGAAIHAIILLIACGVPLIIQLIASDWRNDSYTVGQVSNPVWTLMEIATKDLFSMHPQVAYIVPIAALIVFAANFPEIVREMRHARVAKPARVAEEDEAMVALLHPPRPAQPTSPWD